MENSKIVNGSGLVFNKAWGEIEKEIPFNDTWKNGTGYFDNAVSMVQLTAGSIAKSTDDKDRRIILIGTRWGTVVVFDRYTGQEEGGVYVTNSPRNKLLKLIISGSAVSETEMINLLGPWGDISQNIGAVIEKGLV